MICLKNQIIVKEGDRFSYEPWGGECVATRVRAGLRFWRRSRTADSIVMSWQCENSADVQKLLSGESVGVTWEGRQSIQVRAIDENTFEVTFKGRQRYLFTRMLVSQMEPLSDEYLFLYY